MQHPKTSLPVRFRRAGFPLRNLFFIFIIFMLLTSTVGSALGADSSPIPPNPNPAAPKASRQVFLPMVSANKFAFSPKGGYIDPDAPRGWPMAGANPSRNSWTPEEVQGELDPIWFHYFDAYVSQKVQIIAGYGALFLSASDGLHALDAKSGDELWFFPTDLPLGHSPTLSGNVAYVGGFDHKLYALDAQNGNLLWAFEAEAGFQTNPLVAENLVLAGNRDGYFYAIHASGAKAGQLAWKFETGGPILLSAAYADGVVYFASNDNYAYALRASDGSLVWRSDKLPGHGFHSYWPVIYGDYVIFPGSYNYRYVQPFNQASHTTLEREGAYPPSAEKGDPIGPEGTEPGYWIEGTKTLNAQASAEYFEQNPQRRTTFILKRGNGQEYTYDSDGDGRPEYAPFLWFGTHSGTRFPPIVGADGVLYIANNLYYDPYIPRGKVSGWKLGTPFISSPVGSGTAVDEPIAYAAGGNTIYWKRCCDRVAGAFEITRPGAKADDLERWNYYDDGGNPLRRTLPGLFAKGWDFAYWKHGDQSPPIPYQGKVYLIANNAVVAFAPNGLSPSLPDENPGSYTGQKPEDIERATTVPGLNTKITVSDTTWPQLIAQESFYSPENRSSGRPRYFPLFQIEASGTSPASLVKQDGRIVTQLSSTFDGSQTLSTWISSRSPSTLFENSSNLYRLSGSFAGLAYPTTSGIKVATGSTSLSGPDLSAGWLLVWDSTQSHRWSPVVLTLEKRPAQVNLSPDALEITYNSAAGFLAATPLYGMSAPKSEEEFQWPSGLPQDTVDRVELIDRLARAFPMDAQEDWRLDPSNGDASININYTYHQFSGDWSTTPLPIAYLPGHVALAAWNGSPIRVNGAPLESQMDLEYVTPLGRVAGVPDSPSVTILLPQIGRYWLDSFIGKGSPAQEDPVGDRLTKEVQKMMDAGHLLPYYGITGIWETRADNRIGDWLVDYWHNPADTIYTLVRALPWLPSGIQDQVRLYLRNEFERYPAYKTAHIGWQEGANRAGFDIPPEVLQAAKDYSQDDGTHFNDWGLPPQNLYATWLYAREFGDADHLFAEVKSKLESPHIEQSFPYTLNSYISGYIGYLKLADLAGAGRQSSVERQMIDLLVMRAALAKYPEALARTGFEYGGYQWSLRTISPDMPDTLFNATVSGSLWSQMSLYGFPLDLTYGLAGADTGGDYAFGIDFVGMTTEVAAFLRDYAFTATSALIDSYTTRAPYWFVAEAEETGGEGVFQPLYDRVAYFQAKALIEQEDRSRLELYLDVPAAKTGDLFFIQNLTALLETSAN